MSVGLLHIARNTEGSGDQPVPPIAVAEASNAWVELATRQRWYAERLRWLATKLSR